MKSPDETKKGLECCIEGGCSTCPFNIPNQYTGRCIKNLTTAADSLIQQLEATVSEKEKVVAELSGKIGQLEAERDAMKDEIDRDCETCKNSGACQEEGYCMWCENKESNKTPCCNCVYGCNWEWRGVQKEE